MGIACGVLLFLAGMLAGVFVMGLAQAKRALKVNRLLMELENRLKETEKDWDIPKNDSEGGRFHEIKIFK